MKISCHENDRQYEGHPIEWREPDSAVRKDGSEGRPHRTCSYCGSIHPEDLLKALSEGAYLHSSDWKYGWPHKFYVEKIPNPNKGAMVRKTSGGSYKSEEEAREAGMKYMKDGYRLEVKPIIAPDLESKTFKETGRFEFEMYEPASEMTHAKFYSKHLKDFDEETFKKLIGLIFEGTGVQFARDEKGVKYCVPEGKLRR